ncbi:MAG: hypothetical protein DRI79_01670 [Chloroflexi bacterium]|nr:MAG: hypothetical protein DRI80_08760 [Chloroflexota bacterium]RLC91971.1 MAG: hypothetical protein DRI79_01670 [Chloroflexota bacterium]
MSVQTHRISIQDAQERLPALLEMTRSRKRRFVIEESGEPIAVLIATDVYARLREREQGVHPHVGRVEEVCGGEPIILGTRISVARVVELFKDSDSIDEVLEALPLTPAQVYDALSYYYDNREEVDRILEQRRLENVLRRHNLVLKEVAEGVYEAHNADGRW